MFGSPINTRIVDTVISHLQLAANDQIIDVGCGRGEFLLRTVEKYGCHGLGLDPDAAAIQQLLQTAQERGVSDQIAAFKETADVFDWVPEHYAGMICVGSVHAFETLEGTFKAAQKYVRPGGFLIVADITWDQSPSEEYKAFLGTEGWPPFDRDLLAFKQVGESFGMIPLIVVNSGRDDWDLFEGGFNATRTREALRETDLEARAARLAKINDWYHAYLRWGRTHMAFTLGLFVVPEI